MAAPLLLIKPGSKKAPISLPQLMKLLSFEHLEPIELEVRAFREKHAAQPTVRNHEEFRDAMIAFHTEYERTFHLRENNKCMPPESTLQFLRQHIKDLDTAERNSITGRDRGLIGVLDDLTDALVRQALETHLDFVLTEYVPNDDDMRLWLAEELLRIYGPALFPGEKLRPAHVLAVNIETTLKNFAMNIHTLRKQWRW
jgi:hypothetical protein